MIYSQNKEFQIVLWDGVRHDGAQPAKKLEFDSLDAAREAFEAARSGDKYRSGILMHWHKLANDWTLIDRFTDERT